MNIVAHIKLASTPEHAEALTRTLATANAACNAMSRAALDQRKATLALTRDPQTSFREICEIVGISRITY